MSLIVTLREEGDEKFFVVTVPSILNYDPRNDHPAYTTRGRLLTERLQEEFPGITLEPTAESTLRMRRGTYGPAEWAAVSREEVLEVIRKHQPRIISVMAGNLPGQFFVRTSWPLTANEIALLHTRLDACVTAPKKQGWQPGTLHQLITQLGGCKVTSEVVAKLLEAETIR